MSSVNFGKEQTTTNVMKDIGKVTERQTEVLAQTSNSLQEDISEESDLSIIADNIMNSVVSVVDVTRDMSKSALDKIDSIINSRFGNDLSNLGTTIGFKSHMKAMRANPCSLGSMRLSNLLRGYNTNLQAYSLAAILANLLCSGITSALGALNTLLGKADIDKSVYSKALVSVLKRDNSINTIQLLDSFTSDSEILSNFKKENPKITNLTFKALGKDRSKLDTDTKVDLTKAIMTRVDPDWESKIDSGIKNVTDYTSDTFSKYMKKKSDSSTASTDKIIAPTIKTDDLLSLKKYI